MALNNQESTIIAAETSVAPGGSEAAPNAAGTGATVGPFTDYADTFAYRITNATAPSTAITIAFYGVVGSRLYEVARVSGDTIANSFFSGTIPCPPGFSSFTARAFGNATSAVTVEVYLERQAP